MSNENEVQDECETPWNKKPIIIGLATALGLSGGSIGVLKYLEEQQLEYEASVATDALQLKLQQDNQIKIDTSYEFSQCWSFSTCDPSKWPSALPADTEQFDRLDRMEAAYSRLHQFLKSHCQGHRDKGDYSSDCTDL